MIVPESSAEARFWKPKILDKGLNFIIQTRVGGHSKVLSMEMIQINLFQSKTDSMEDALEAVGLAGTDWERSGRASPW